MRTSFLIICSLVLVFCFWLLLHRPFQPTEIKPSQIQVDTTNQQTKPESHQSGQANIKAGTTNTLSQRSPLELLRSLGIDTNSRTPIVEQMWQKPIDFYGKVIDENSNPVADVDIKFRWTDLTATNQERTSSTESDTGGLFSLRGKHGGSMTFWFGKQGYYSSDHGQMSFNYAVGPDILSPDPRNPVVIHLRKKGQGVELVTSKNGIRSNLAIRIQKSGAPALIDFFQKQASATGQLEISQIKPPWQTTTNWSFSLKIPDGGLVENQDEFQFQAPESGYQSTVEYNFLKSDPIWTTQVTKQFYICFGSPREYGWLRIDSNLSQETVFLTYAINPSGSRKLEPK